MNCEICEKETSCTPYFYAVYSTDSTMTTSGIKQITTTTETLKSIATVNVCEECLVKGRKSNKAGRIAAITITIAFMMFLLVCMLFSFEIVTQLPVLLASPISAVIALIISLFACKPDADPVLAADLKKKKLKCREEKWVPLVPDLYRNPKTNQMDLNKYTASVGLKTDVGMLPFIAMSNAKTPEEAVVMFYLMVCPKDKDGNPIQKNNAPKVSLSKEAKKVILKKE